MSTRVSTLTRSAIDLFALIKPRVTALVLATTTGGFWLASSRPRATTSSFPIALFAVALLVGAANTFNMYLERDVDALMKRTQNRPLPAKRLAPEAAFRFGILLAIGSVSLLTLSVNPLTALLGVIAFITYVLCYTPLKQKTTMALLVGAVPGAMPPLMGWTAATGSVDLIGLNLFLILFFWQLPHFLAIALFNKEEYQKAGIKVLPLKKGEAATKHWIVRTLALLIPVTLFPSFLGMAGQLYFWIALVLGIAFSLWGGYGLKAKAESRWARSFFLASIVYLPLLFLALLLLPEG